VIIITDTFKATHRVYARLRKIERQFDAKSRGVCYTLLICSITALKTPLLLVQAPVALTEELGFGVPHFNAYFFVPKTATNGSILASLFEPLLPPRPCPSDSQK
jgi:hypothetical protein